MWPFKKREQPVTTLTMAGWPPIKPGTRLSITSGPDATPETLIVTSFVRRRVDVHPHLPGVTTAQVIPAKGLTRTMPRWLVVGWLWASRRLQEKD